MGVMIESRNKPRAYPRPHGAEVEFYLGRGVRGVQGTQDGEILPVNVNGHDYQVQFGKKNKVPKEVYDVLMNSQSRTRVVDVREAEERPRHQSAFGRPPVKEEYVRDYEIELINISSK